jgi:hypothetical protein
MDATIDALKHLDAASRADQTRRFSLFEATLEKLDSGRTAKDRRRVSGSTGGADDLIRGTDRARAADRFEDTNGKLPPRGSFRQMEGMTLRVGKQLGCEVNQLLSQGRRRRAFG